MPLDCTKPRRRTGYMESPACPVPPTGRFTRLRGLKCAKPSLGGGGWWRWCGRGDALQVRCATALQTWCLWWRFGRLLPKPVGVTGTSTPSWRWWQSLVQTLPFFAPWGGPGRCRKHGPRAGSPAGWQTSPMNSAIPSEGPMRASWPRLRNRGYANQNGSYRNSSELRGNEQLTAGGQWVQTLGAPGAED